MPLFALPTPDAVPIWFVTADEWETVKGAIGEAAAAFAERCGFKPKPGRLQLVPGEGGRLAGVLFGVEAAGSAARDPLAAGRLATSLPEGVYRFANPPTDAGLSALGFLLALYRYDRFKKDTAKKPQLVAPDGIDAARIERIAAAVAAGRDLVNAVFLGQNLAATDITEISAGRDIVGTTTLEQPLISYSPSTGQEVFGPALPTVQGNTFVVGGDMARGGPLPR